MVRRAGRLWPPRRVARLDDMPGAGPQCGGAEGMIAMRRFAVIVTLGALLSMIGGAATAAPALAMQSSLHAARSTASKGEEQGAEDETKSDHGCHFGWP